MENVPEKTDMKITEKIKSKKNFKPPEKARYFESKLAEDSKTNEEDETTTDFSPKNKGKHPKHGKHKKKSYNEDDGTEVYIPRAERFRNYEDKQRPRQHRRDRDPFPGPKNIPESAMKKYARGKQYKDVITRNRYGSRDLKYKEKKLHLAVKEAARTELLMQEDHGFLEKEEGEETTTITQHDLANVVDVTSATKFFELKMNDFGPYRINYTRNGRFLLMGGAKGHVAAVDWMTKRLLCEMNVMETVNDIRWLHQETMFAVAQKKWTYIYDNQGIELHCLKLLDSVMRMEFLPYHFLLATASSKGYLSYIDVSVGEKVAGYSSQMGRLDVMAHNPSNAIVALGHTGGTVTQWCPKMNEPVVKMLCHNSAVRSIAINKDGQYMATSGIDRTLKIWDMRTFKMLQSYKIAMGAGQLAFSQQGLLATGMGSIVQVYNDCCRQAVEAPYLVHDLTSSVASVQFCPYEDVLGVGHGAGFSSLIIPGAGEANFDALESNPYQTKKQRREAEVKMLLEKIPADMIHLDKNIIVQVDKKAFKDKVKVHNQNKSLLPLQLEYKPFHKKEGYVPRYKKKGLSKGLKLVQRKKGVIEEHKREHIKEVLKGKQSINREKTVTKFRKTSVLDRFKRKDE